MAKCQGAMRQQVCHLLMEEAQFAQELVLERSCVGRDGHRATALCRPMDSRHEIPTCLADSGTSLDEGKLPTSQRVPDMASELPLPRPCLVIRAGRSRQRPAQSEDSLN